MPKSSAEQPQKTPVPLISERLIRVLHVDDDADFLKSSKRILEIQGSFQIEPALSVKEALQKLAEKTYDAIVSDYQMSETDGLDFLKELRDSGKEVSFILFTGKGREEIAIKAINLGADRYFDKKGKPATVYAELAHGITTAVKAKQAEKALLKSEEKYRKQFEEAMDSIFLADAETGILLDCNRAATKLVCRTKSEIIGAHQSILHPMEEVDGKFSRTFTQHINNKEGQVLETQVITKTGEIREVAVKANIFELGEKKVLQGIFRDITDRKKMEKQLQQEQETIEQVTENIGAGLSIISKDYKILWANNFLKNIFGDMQGKTCYTTYNDLNSVCPGCGVKKIFETGENHVVHEQLVPGLDGQRVWIELTATPIRDERGNIVAASELALNVNERKQLESKFREAEKRYRAIFDKTPLGILIIDSNGTAVNFNEEAHRQLGYSREEFEKLTVSDYEVLETPDDTRARMTKILKTGKDEFETKHRTKTGEIRDIKNTVQVIELGGKKYFQVITRDITERKKITEQLKESERKYRLLTENTTDVIYIQDMNLDITYASSSVEKVSGYTPEEMLKLTPKEFMTPESFERGVADFKETIMLAAENPNYEIPLKQYEYVRKDGSTFWGELKMKLLRDSNNNFVGFQGSLRDITERKRAEEKLERMMNKLVAINEKLGVIGKLTRHDARNKLSTIANNAYLAKQKLKTNFDALDHLEDIESAIDQMEKIFDFARNYERLGVEELSYTDVEKNVDEAAMLLSCSGTIKLVNECQGLMVMADSLLRQVFYNLIDDTLKYGETFSQIRVYYEEEENQLKLVYEDDGVGVPENEKEKIFYEGYGKSTGYGLFLIKKICESYGWTIQETGVPGKGAQFTITIPKTNNKELTLYRFDNE
jgi:PAS domain S-box-containing protein